MSKNVAIKEGDTSRLFSGVKAIKVVDQGGGSSYWVPEDDRKLGTKHITKNGVYKASEEKDDDGKNKGWCGYSQVTTNIMGKAIGTEDDGNEHEIYPDDNGYLVDNAIPSSIAFTVRPTKVIYNTGDDINLAGATVRAYLKNGNPWDGDEQHPNGYISLSELILDPAKAYGSGGSSSDYTDGDGINAIKLTPTRTVVDDRNLAEYILFEPYIGEGYWKKDYYSSDPPEHAKTYLAVTKSRGIQGVDSIYITKYLNAETASYSVLTLVKRNGDFIGQYFNYNFIGIYDDEYTVPMGSGSMDYNETFASGGWGITGYSENIPESTEDPVGTGDDTLYPTAQTIQTIQVKWDRVGEGKELTTSFEIRVNPTGGQGSSTHESSSGEEHGGGSLGGF